ncbi:MAG: carboxylesterase family protein, partial [Clostridia bacterium]|nr:carboxylesterase family protein [Clostridia bacterium]
MAERIRKSIPQGTLIGLQDGTLQIFKNIPYAAPPVGALRFRPPAAPPHWDGERDGTVFGPAPLQPDL